MEGVEQVDHQPNVIVFLTDQQRFDSTGVHGNPLDLTPNFDRVAREGTFLANAFTCQPVCAPARSSILTGRYASRTGVFRNGIPLPHDATTLAHCFAAAGYDTAYIGKWHLAGTDNDPVPPDHRGGFDHWLGADVVEFLSDAYDARLYDGDGTLRRLPGYRADAYVDAAIDYLAGRGDGPFFLFLSLIEPHHQNTRDDYPAPVGYAERYADRWMPPDLEALGGSAPGQIAGYWGMVKRVDEAFGRLLDALLSLDRGADTIVAFTTDHGCHFKTRNDEYKRSAHEASIRIPMAITGPGFGGIGAVTSLISLVDLAPTLLDAASVPVPEQMQGRSMLPLVRAEPVAWPDDVLVQISESQVGRALRTHRWKYVVAAPEADGWTDPGASRYVETELYDLSVDPYELTNLVGTPELRRVAGDLRARLVRRIVDSGEPAPEIVPGIRPV